MWAWSSLWFPRYPWRYATMEGSDRWGGPEGSTVSWSWKSYWKSFRKIRRRTSCFLILILSWPSRGCSRPSCSPSTRERPVEDNCTQSRRKLWSYFWFLYFLHLKMSFFFVRPVCSLALPIGDWLLHRPNDPWHMMHYYFFDTRCIIMARVGF